MHKRVHHEGQAMTNTNKTTTHTNETLETRDVALYEKEHLSVLMEDSEER